MKTCILRIQDRVNCKFEGLDPFVRRKVVEQLKFFVPYARHMPAFKLGRWDGKVAFASVGGGTYINLLDRVLPLIIDEGYDIEIVDETETVAFDFPEVDEDFVSDKVWPEGHPIAGEPIMLRDYQVEAIRRYLANPQSIQSISTGAGKTVLSASLSKLCEPYGRTIVIVPNKSLVEQTEEDYRNIGLDVGVYFGDRKEWGHTHSVCTWQSLSVLAKNTRSGGSDRSIEEFLDGVIGVLIDECFAGDTPVLTPQGNVTIDSLKPGDIIVNFSEEFGIFKEDTVVKLHKNLTTSSTEEMLELELDDGRTVQVTANHKFLTDRGWIRADELTTEDDIVSFN